MFSFINLILYQQSKLPEHSYSLSFGIYIIFSMPSTKLDKFNSKYSFALTLKVKALVARHNPTESGDSTYSRRYQAERLVGIYSKLSSLILIYGTPTSQGESSSLVYL